MVDFHGEIFLRKKESYRGTVSTEQGQYHPNPPTSTTQAGDAGGEQTLKQGSPFPLHPISTGQYLCAGALQSPLGLKAEWMCNCSWAG